MIMLTAQSSPSAAGGMRLPILTAPAPANAASLDEPHAWLGLPADETCPGRITAAARRQLDAIRDAGGADDAVKEVVIAIIVAARQTLLARAVAQ